MSKKIGLFSNIIVLSFGSIFMIFPLLWTVSTSLKNPNETTYRELDLIPKIIAWENYIRIFELVPLLTYSYNTMTIVIFSLFGGIFVCSLTGYVFAKIDFPGKNILFSLLLSSMMLPFVVQMIPLFLMFDYFGMVNTFLPLTIPRLLAHNAFYIFLYRQVFKGYSNEIIEAAKIDGASDFRIWWKIILPTSIPILAAVAIFSFQYAWNDFLSPLIYLTGDENKWTLALALNFMNSMEGEASDINLLLAVATLIIVPMLLMFSFSQNYILKGINITSGIK